MGKEANKDMLMAAIAATNLDPAERIGRVRDSGAVLYEVIGGSHAYGTNIVGVSDEDRRGIFCLPCGQYLSTKEPVEQLSDDRKIEGKKKNDDVFYTLKRIFGLLKNANPNCIELLWIPADCVMSSSPEFDLVIKHRNLFISKACLGSHYGYAKDQLSKMRGKGKKVMNPQPKERPKKLDFCRVIPCIPGAKPWMHPDVRSSTQPFRPIHLKEMPWVDLKDYHIAAVEHMKDAYRMYYYGEGAKGVFRGDDMLACESIPLDDEWPRFSGILLYDEVEYERAVKEWKSYWDWISNRNINRWQGRDETNFKFDHKNAMHCMRLLMSGINIVKYGEPIVRFSGEQFQYLMDIRLGKIDDYDRIMADVQAKVSEMEDAAKTSSIPEKVDEAKIEELYAEVSDMAWGRLYGWT